MATGESVAKKLKRGCQSDTVNFNSRLNSEEIEDLKRNLKSLDEKNSALCLLKIISCNAAAGYGVSFTKAACPTERQSVKLHSFISLFTHGKTLVSSYLENGNNLANDDCTRSLMSKLLTFLSDNTGAAEALQVNPSYKLTETDWTVRLAHHYFSKLSATSAYRLDDHYHTEKVFCDCGCRENIIEHYGDTSLGNGAGWHGYVDILLGSSDLSVVVLGKAPVSPVGRRSTEVRKDYFASHPDQVLAQTIVFSFLQKKRHPEYKNFLIPCIAASKKNIYFYFYDSKHDLLLESPAFPIFNLDKSLNKLTILATWFVINYKYLCSGTTDMMLKSDFKAEFFKHASDKISMYRDELSICRGFETVKRARLEPWHMNCEVTHGKPVDEEQIVR